MTGYRSFVAAVVCATAIVGCEGEGTRLAAADGQSTDTDALSADTDAPFAAGDPVEGDTCANLDLTLERQPATIALVVDHSASMDTPLGDNDTRWSVLVQALMGTSVDPLSGLVYALENQVRFGLVSFTAKRNEPASCPLLETVPPALHNGAQIAAVLAVDDPTYKGASPVPEGVAAAVAMLEAVEEPGRKLIVLATDDAPQTCDSLAQPDPRARDATVAAVQAAYEQGIETFVVGLAAEQGGETYFQRVANAGRGFPPDGAPQAPYYLGLTENSLVSAVSEVLSVATRTCVYELHGSGIREGAEAEGSVLLDGEPVPLGDTEFGWRLESASEIELLGRACDVIQVGNHHLQADFACRYIILL